MQCSATDMAMEIADPDYRIDPSLLLREDEVHLWRVDLNALATEELQWSGILSEDERLRAARFHFRVDRQHFIAGRAWLRRIIGAYLAMNPEALVFVYSEKSKPSLGGAHIESGLNFNVSHSGGLALIALTRGRQIGVDVEYIRHDFETSAIAARFFSVHEQEQLAALPIESQHEAFFRCWTRKEAYIKATGDGLSLPLSQFDVSILPGDHDALLATRPDELETKRWSLQDLQVGTGYCGALCVAGVGWKLISWPERT